MQEQENVPVIDPVEIGVRVRALRTGSHQTQTALAARLGTTKSTVSRIEYGKVPLTTHTLQALADTLGVSWLMLVGIGPRLRCPCCNGTGWV